MTLCWSTNLSFSSRRAQHVLVLMTGMREQAKIPWGFWSPRLERATLSILPQSIPPSKVTSSPDLIHEERDTSDMRGTAVIQQRGMNTGRCEELALVQSVTPALKRGTLQQKSVDWGWYSLIPCPQSVLSRAFSCIPSSVKFFFRHEGIKTGTFLGPLLTRNRNYSHVNLLWSTKPIYLFTYNYEWTT